MPAGVKELEDAARNIIQIIKQIPEFGGTRLKIAGGLALRHYLDQHQPVDDKIEFVADLPASLELFKVKLLEHPLSPFTQDKQGLFYSSPEGRRILIKFSGQVFCQVKLPLIHDIGYGDVPYVSPQELGRLHPGIRSRASDVKKRQCDAKDAPAPRIRLTVGARPRQLSDENFTEHSAITSHPQGFIVKNAVNDGNLGPHRRARSEPGLRSLSVTMTQR
ncbi:hypothetical protein F5B21DRAFT_502896 [Xylaria acuta]|nr:hypothetical protein F5B21DRAFT_502896 [Xylaria acuta]